MKVCKTALCLILTILIFISAAPKLKSYAESARYAYVNADSTVYLCSEKREDSALFAIPQTYCVEILNEDGDWFYAKYAEENELYRAVYGYCLKENMTKINEPLENLYLHTTLQVTYRTDQGSNLLPPLEIKLTAAYYGSYTLGNTSLSYVYCGEKFGYVSERVINYPLNELPQPVISEQDPTPSGEDNAMLICALVITFAAAAAIVVLYFSGRRKPG